MLHDVSTAIILLELMHRVRDQLDDPEPQYDLVLSNRTRRDLRELETALETVSIYEPKPEEV
jgi:hypothetical protein